MHTPFPICSLTPASPKLRLVNILLPNNHTFSLCHPYPASKGQVTCIRSFHWNRGVVVLYLLANTLGSAEVFSLTIFWFWPTIRPALCIQYSSAFAWKSIIRFEIRFHSPYPSHSIPIGCSSHLFLQPGHTSGLLPSTILLRAVLPPIIRAQWLVVNNSFKLYHCPHDSSYTLQWHV